MKKPVSKFAFQVHNLRRYDPEEPKGKFASWDNIIQPFAYSKSWMGSMS